MIGKLLAVMLVALVIVTVVGIYEFRYEVLVPSAAVALGIGYLMSLFFVKRRSQMKWIALMIVVVFFMLYFTIAEFVDWIGSVMLLIWVVLLSHRLWRVKI